MNRGRFIYDYARCLSCGAIYLKPPTPTPSFSDIYGPDYPAWTKNKARLFSRRLLIDLPQVRAVRRFKKRGKLLDVGCGMGTFLARLKREEGWDAEGIEPSSDGCHLAREHYGLSLWEGMLEEAPFDAHSMDVITLWDVLEHAENPRSLLQAAFRLLKKDGVILLSMPNIGSVVYPGFKGRWHFLQPPYHVCHFSAKRLVSLLEEEGFDMLSLYTTLSSLYESVFCSLQLVLRRGEERVQTPLQKIRKKIMAFLRIPLGLTACLMATPLLLIAHVCKRGDRMIVIARKP
ncbi:MAG: class I SAM-dependent methyltransferase [Candidatus Omnitrophota bacterium]